MPSKEVLGVKPDLKTTLSKDPTLGFIFNRLEDRTIIFEEDFFDDDERVHHRREPTTFHDVRITDGFFVADIFYSTPRKEKDDDFLSVTISADEGQLSAYFDKTGLTHSTITGSDKWTSVERRDKGAEIIDFLRGLVRREDILLQAGMI